MIPDPQTFLNMMLWEIIRRQGGSITFTEQDLRNIKADEVGCVKVEYRDNRSVTLEAVDRATVDAYLDSFDQEKH